MGRNRRLFISTFILLLAGGSLLSIIVHRELWPFSPYGMYSDAKQNRNLTWLQLRGVAPSGDETPIYEFDQLKPFDKSRLLVAIRGMVRRDRPDQVKAALNDIFQRYERLRKNGEHSGPEIKALRLYRVTWAYDPLARNYDRPDQKELIEEGGP
jgi:hypothetical protein